ncbi:uncharacterized protein DS421_5g164430 [Arachis hypogaea]|nr:uncharacterized protein DS421_5g164430 [Arachis hypogaea]
MSSFIASQSTIEDSSSSKTILYFPSSSTPSSSRPVFVVPKIEYIELLYDDKMLIVCEICAETKYKNKTKNLITKKSNTRTTPKIRKKQEIQKQKKATAIQKSEQEQNQQ